MTCLTAWALGLLGGLIFLAGGATATALIVHTLMTEEWSKDPDLDWRRAREEEY